jgi:hypothetical protein
MNSIQGEILTSEVCVSDKSIVDESCKWQIDKCLADQLRELECILYNVNTYLADQLRELESQSVQGALLIHVQRYDIMYLERTGNVISDIIKY